MSAAVFKSRFLLVILLCSASLLLDGVQANPKSEKLGIRTPVKQACQIVAKRVSGTLINRISTKHPNINKSILVETFEDSGLLKKAFLLMKSKKILEEVERRCTKDGQCSEQGMQIHLGALLADYHLAVTRFVSPVAMIGSIVIGAVTIQPEIMESPRRLAAISALAVVYHLANKMTEAWSAKSASNIVRRAFQSLVPDDMNRIFPSQIDTVATLEGANMSGFEADHTWPRIRVEGFFSGAGSQALSHLQNKDTEEAVDAITLALAQAITYHPGIFNFIADQGRDERKRDLSTYSTAVKLAFDIAFNKPAVKAHLLGNSEAVYEGRPMSAKELRTAILWQYIVRYYPMTFRDGDKGESFSKDIQKLKSEHAGDPTFAKRLGQQIGMVSNVLSFLIPNPSEARASRARAIHAPHAYPYNDSPGAIAESAD